MKNTEKIIPAILIIIALLAGPAFSARVKNESIRQEGNRVVITYDLAGNESDANVIVTVTVNGKQYTDRTLHMEGDVGNVAPGKGKTIYWNVLGDYPKGFSSDITVVVRTVGLLKSRMVKVKPGCFQMGDVFGDGESIEKPVHKVCLDGFNISEYEVTVGEFRQFVKATGYKSDAQRSGGCYYWTGGKWKLDAARFWDNPGYRQTDNFPVVCVSWNDAQAFLSWKSEQDWPNYRLPTEAEWEYAARSAGQAEKYSWGRGKTSGNVADRTGKAVYDNLITWAGYDDGYVHAAPVGSFSPNALGLFDITGNVWEWTNDRYMAGYYLKSPEKNPQGPMDGKFRVMRGASWKDGPRSCRIPLRNWGPPEYRDYMSGFRYVMVK